MRSPIYAHRNEETPENVNPLGLFGRGNLIHRLLEILPDLPEVKRQGAAARFMALQANVSEALGKDIIAEVLAVIDNPDFAPFFAPGSKAEVSLAGHPSTLPDHVVLNGQIDRLSVRGDEVWVIDYKSNRPPPKSEAAIPEIYIRQMAAYRALLRDLYPGKLVKCALLWTDGPRLMTVPDALMDTVNWQKVFGRTS